MMIVMTPQASAEQIEAVKARLESLGRLHVLVMPGELTTAIGAIGDPEGVAELGIDGPTSWPPRSWRTTSRPCSTSAGGRSAAARPSA
jgi:hypothetical protein